MSNSETIIENVNATMSMEDMPLLDSDKEHIRECLEGKVDFQDAINALINKYMHK
ncbi:hypothetical protein QA584_18775 [Anaerocolumna sp. AGMB13025]|uniref:hypothetical protein n=1 Tax=Anaerocolumna sp. AGMB13025 TaxID=3039116 RepID=UPI0024203ABE|nr:hypothetical protein [Anaerocolumna sp. AGMB13025]WFR55642.1 hypothetical protein QA584_18775 [Anaerocolumna sp. AGMB13025]